MGATRCLISTRPTQELAAQLGVSPERGVLIAGIWQTRNNSSAFPSVEVARELLNTLVEQKKWEEEVQKYFDNMPPVKAADFTGSVDFDYMSAGRPGLVSTTAIEAIRSGERTASTRFKHIDEKWKKLKVGDTVEFTDYKGNNVIVRVTKPLTKITTDTNAEEWSQKEGFSADYFNAYIKYNSNAWQFEFEYIGDKLTLANDRVASYTGDIVPEEGTIFVFGSNPEGRHGSGAAKVAATLFGAQMGVGEGRTGNAYALPTKDLRVKENDGKRSISPEAIIENIKKLYAEARRNPNLKYKIAYRNGENEATLNGYTGAEMIDMFIAAGPIPSNIIFSKEWASSERFNNATIAAVNQNKKYHAEEVLWTPTIPDINLVAVEENVLRLARAFTPQQLAKRIKNVSYHFSNAVDILYSRKIKELKDKQGGNKPKVLKSFEALADTDVTLAWDLVRLQDPKKGKETFVLEYLNVTEAIAETKKAIQEKYERLQKTEKTDANRESLEYQLGQFERMLDNFDLLLLQALSDIEASEGIRINVSKVNTATNKKQLVGDVDVADTEEGEMDNLNAHVESGNSGWAFKARKADPHKTLTQNVRRILRQIPMVGNNALDDLGYQQFMDFEFTYATILNGCTDMIDSKDFDDYQRDENGSVKLNSKGNPIRTLPALEKLAGKYSWLQGVIHHLKANPTLISEFYSCFRMDYIPYYMLSNGKMAKVNSEMSTANAIDSIMRNYEQGQILHKDSIFTTSGTLNHNAAKIGSAKAEELLAALNNEDFDDYNYEELNDLLKMLGIYVDGNLTEFLNLDSVPEDTREINKKSLTKILNRAKAICDRLNELQPYDHLVTHFNSEYTDIAKIVGSVTMFNRNMVFRQGEHDYPSYSTPNYITTLFKKLTSPSDARRAAIFNFYRQSDWFFDTKRGRWRNFMLNALMNNSALVEELREGALLNINTIRESDDIFGQSKTIEYKDWTPAQIKQLFITAYFTGGTSASSTQQYGYYNFPIFADTECAMMFKFLRFTDNYEAQILPLLREVVYQELGRRKLVNERKKNGAAEIANFDKNGDKFFFFHELNSYKVEIGDEFIRGFYKHKLKSADETEKKAIENKLKTLKPANRAGKTLADFNDVISAYQIMGNLEAINSTIDSAIKDIMNQQFTAFMNNLGDNIPLLQAMVNDNLIPQSELDAAVERNDSKTRKEKKVALKNESTHKIDEGKPKEEQTAKYSSLEEALREYCWNNALMQTQIIELTTVDPAFYKFDGGIDFQKRYKEVYASGRKLDTNSRFGRELQRTIYATDRVTASRIFNNIKALFDRAVKEGRVTESDRDSIMDAFSKVNNTDAQALRTPSSMRAVLDMAGMWTEEMEQTYKNIMSDNWDAKDFSVIWQTLKPFTYAIINKEDGSGQTGDGHTLLIPHQNKDSEFLILAAYQMFAAATSQNKRLRALNKFMEGHNLNGVQFDVVVYESGVKAGCQKPIDLNISMLKDSEGKTVLDKIADHLWRQIEEHAKEALGKKYVPGRNKKNFYAGTTALLTSGTITQEEYNSLMDFVEPSEQEMIDILNAACFKKGDNGNIVENYETVHIIPYSDYMIATPNPEHWIDSKVIDGSQKRNLLVSDIPDGAIIVVNGRKMTKEKLLTLYDNLIIENLLDDYEVIKREVSDVKSLQKFLIQQIKDNPKYSRDFQNVLDLINNNSDFAVPLEFPSIKNKIVELILSKFKNGITKQKAKGGSCILVADTTNTLGIVLEDGTYLDTKDKEAVENAKQHNFIKGFECFLPAWSREFYTDFIVERKDGDRTWNELDIEKLRKQAPELLEMSGIRIPTEDKYSMTPLIVKGFLPVQSGSAVMLPAETTTIVGLDFDNDKMFIRLFNTFRDDKGIHKIEYNYDSTPEAQSREARENALLDIELGILRSKVAAEALFNPGNFDPIKKEGRVAQILSDVTDTGDSLLAIWQEMHGIKYQDIDAAIESLHNASVDEVKNFVDKFSKKRSLLSVDTFVYNHQQNMVGAALIGMYANNTTGQAKMQTTRLAIKDEYTFTLEGNETVNGVKGRRLIKSLHDIYSTNKEGVKERISKRCAYFSNASVDNVKDPALARIRQNTKTANVAGFMLRAGLDVEEISLLFCQPYIAYIIDTTGDVPSAKMIEFQLDYYNQKYGTSLDINKLRSKIKGHLYTKNELATNIVKLNRYRRMFPEDIQRLSQTEREQLVENAMMAILLFNQISGLAKQFRGSIQISRADSPNGAIAHTLEQANLQLRRVDEYMSNAGAPNFGIENITDIMQNRVAKVSDSKEELRRKLRDENVKVHRLQAFHTLGIELAQQLIAIYFISQSPACQDIVRNIEANIAKDVILGEKGLKILYNDFTTYLLSKTKRFGDEEGQTFEQKRDYYLYQYPQQFVKVLKEHQDIAAMAGVNLLRVTEGQIVMERSGKITPALRDSIMTGFDSLIRSDNEVARRLAIDLFMYAYYNEGLIPRHNSYGQFFSSFFLRRFPDVLDALRGTPDERVMANFFEQWCSQKDNLKYFTQVQNASQNGTNTIKVEAKDVANNDSYLLTQRTHGEVRPYNYVVFNDELYTFDHLTEGNAAIYKKVGMVDAGPTEDKLHKFNANVTTDVLAGIEVNPERVENLKLLNRNSFRTLQTQAASSPLAAAERMAEQLEGAMAMADESMINGLDDDAVDTGDIDLDAVGSIPDIDFNTFDGQLSGFDNVDGFDGANVAAEYNIEDGQQTLIDNGEDVVC